MSDLGQQEASQIEKNLARALGDSNASKVEVLAMVNEVPSEQRFVMLETWRKLASDDSLENWRRLEAYKLLIKRCLSLPCAFKDFVKDVIAPMGVAESEIVDMTMGQVLPIERNGDLILMVNLPIATSSGPASLYFAVSRSENRVLRAAVHPETVDA